jgi:hypothetical protein
MQKFSKDYSVISCACMQIKTQASVHSFGCQERFDNEETSQAPALTSFSFQSNCQFLIFSGIYIAWRNKLILKNGYPRQKMTLMNMMEIGS